MAEVPFSPFVIEYAILERKPEDDPQSWRELMLTTEFDIAYGAYSGLNAQFKMRERWSNGALSPDPQGVGRFRLVARLVGAKWVHPEEVTGHLEALTEGLRLLDQKHGMT